MKTAASTADRRVVKDMLPPDFLMVLLQKTGWLLMEISG
jgi:hypothetical protein